MIEMFRVFLWGIDGEFHGNEDRLYWTLPVIRVEPDGFLYAVRSADDWSLVTQNNLHGFSSAKEAEEYVTPLAIPDPPEIMLGDLVAVMGPGFSKALLGLMGAEDPANTFSGISHKIIGTRDGFILIKMPASSYEEYSRRLDELARDTFDSELKAVCRRSISNLAEAALFVFRHCGRLSVTPWEEHCVRILAAKRIRGDEDAYLRLLVIGAAQLGESTEDTEKRVRKYLED